ncbi:hypothetical protein BHM03_00052881 [Ensete ventricosum]|nr:hypothetical protein BHM03_00052881 [Ensete ventricosum]
MGNDSVSGLRFPAILPPTSNELARSLTDLTSGAHTQLASWSTRVGIPGALISTSESSRTKSDQVKDELIAAQFDSHS